MDYREAARSGTSPLEAEMAVPSGMIVISNYFHWLQPPKNSEAGGLSGHKKRFDCYAGDLHHVERLATEAEATLDSRWNTLVHVSPGRYRVVDRYHTTDWDEHEGPMEFARIEKIQMPGAS